MVHYRGGPALVDPAVYPDMEGFWADLAAAYAEEVRRLAALGCGYLQFDDTSLAYLNDRNAYPGGLEPEQPGLATGEDAEHDQADRDQDEQPWTERRSRQRAQCGVDAL